MPRVLIAGATGYLGRYVVREFHERGYQVRVLVRNPDKLFHSGPYLEPAVADYIHETFQGEITRPATLEGACDQIDIVFSSVGITRQKDKLSYRDVDYQGNVNLLNNAIAASIKKFIYVSVFNAHLFRHLEIVRAHEDFVDELKKSVPICSRINSQNNKKGCSNEDDWRNSEVQTSNEISRFPHPFQTGCKVE